MACVLGGGVGAICTALAQKLSQCDVAGEGDAAKARAHAEHVAKRVARPIPVKPYDLLIVGDVLGFPGGTGAAFFRRHAHAGLDVAGLSFSTQAAIVVKSALRDLRAEIGNLLGEALML